VLAMGIASYGVGAPLVQRRSLETAHVETATFLALLAGAVFSVATFFAGPALVRPFFGETVADLVHLASPAFFFSGAGVVPQALRLRALDFRSLGIIEAASTIVAAAMATILASVGFDAESLVLGSLTGLVVSTGLLVAAGPRARPRWNPRAARELAAFGIPACGASLAYTAFQNVDYAIVAARLGATQAGFYWRAYQLSVVYQERLSGIILRIAFPVYARSGALDQLRRLRLRMGQAQTLLVFPFLAFLIVVAPEFVPLLFGSQWSAAVLPTQILAVTGMAFVCVTGTTPLLWAAGKPRGLALFNIGLLSGYVVVVFAVAPLGLIPLCIGVTCFSVTALCVQLALERAVGVQLGDVWESFMPALTASAIELVVAFPAARAMAEAGISDVVVVLCSAVVAGCAYSVSARVLFPVAVADTLFLVRRLAGGGGSRSSQPLVGVPQTAE